MPGQGLAMRHNLEIDQASLRMCSIDSQDMRYRCWRDAVMFWGSLIGDGMGVLMTSDICMNSMQALESTSLESVGRKEMNADDRAFKSDIDTITQY